MRFENVYEILWDKKAKFMIFKCPSFFVVVKSLMKPIKKKKNPILKLPDNILLCRLSKIKTLYL